MDTLSRGALIFSPTYGVSFTAPESQTIYGDTAGNLFVKVRKQIDETNWDEATTFMDGLGRSVKTQAKDSQGDVFVEMEYDNMSRVKRVTNPYRQGDAKLWTTNTFDATGRPWKITTPDNAVVETQYGLATTGTEIGTTTTVIDQALKQRRSITNALGQLTRVDEPNLNNELGSVNSPNQATRYFYNALGKMTRVQQGIQNRYFMYDSLGRMIRVKQPEQEVNIALNTTGNPDNNSWSAGFTYDVLGNVLTSTDAKGTVITNTYDRANRVTTRTYSNEPTGVTTPVVSYFYDGKGLAQIQSPNFAKGKLTKVTSSVSTTENMTFDNFGRLTRSRQITDGVVYGDDAHPMTYSYNLSGALIEQKYPSGRVVKNEFESDGDIARISGKPTSTATEQMYATGFQYFADGKIERLKLGNGLWESAKLNNRMQATEIAMGHSVGDGSLMKLSYEYGELSANGASVITSKNAGNIARQTVSFSGLTHPFVQTYRYDSLHRIAEAIEKVNDNQTWKQTFGYDIYGNRNAFYQKVGEQELVINNLTAPTVDQNTNRFNANQGYGYDKNGNITTDPANSGRSFVFNGDNKQTQVKNSSEVTIGTYLYDGDGKRVKKVTNLETTVFVYDGLGKLVAEYSTATPPTNPTINYTATDKLGSPRVITDKLGNVVSRRDFLPFGEEIYANSSANRTEANKYSLSGQDSVRKRFTGYEKDQETGLDFAEARYYQNQHGRFTAIDPLLASGKSINPQTFNRYVYSLNRPLTHIDPTGMQAGTPVNQMVVSINPQGAWYAEANVSSSPVYIQNGSSVPKNYERITAKNKYGQLIYEAAKLDEFHVIRLHENGPMSSTMHASLTLMGLKVTDFERRGWEQIFSDRVVEPVRGVRDAITPPEVALFAMPFKVGVVGRSATGAAGEVESTALTRFYPANNGFLGETRREFLMPNTIIDRYGSSQGRFFSPGGTPSGMRSLPPGSNPNFSSYRVIKPFEVEAGTAAPAFGQTGLGTQFQAPRSASELIRRNIIEEIKP